MRRIFQFGAVALAAIGLAACGEPVQVAPAQVGAVLDENGYKIGEDGRVF